MVKHPTRMEKKEMELERIINNACNKYLRRKKLTEFQKFLQELDPPEHAINHLYGIFIGQEDLTDFTNLMKTSKYRPPELYVQGQYQKYLIKLKTDKIAEIKKLTGYIPKVSRRMSIFVTGNRCLKQRKFIQLNEFINLYELNMPQDMEDETIQVTYRGMIRENDIPSYNKAVDITKIKPTAKPLIH